MSASLAATLKVVDGPLLTVGPNDLAPGVRYTFQLVVTNWLGGSGTAEFVVDKVAFFLLKEKNSCPCLWFLKIFH